MLLLALSSALTYLWPHVFVAIHSGEGGVLWRRFWGGTELDWSFREGTAVVWPWNRVHVYDLTVQQLRVDVPVYTSDGLSVMTSVSARFSLDREHLPRLHKELGPDYVEKLVKPELMNSIRTMIGRYNSEQVYTHGELRLPDELREDFRARLEGQGIDFHEVLLVKLKIPERVQGAIQEKLVHEQEVVGERHVELRRRIEAAGLRAFESISGISALRWRALETTAEIAKSPNSKIVIVGTDSASLPVLLNSDLTSADVDATSEHPEQRGE